MLSICYIITGSSSSWPEFGELTGFAEFVESFDLFDWSAAFQMSSINRFPCSMFKG
jgi:hypothetical protein